VPKALVRATTEKLLIPLPDKLSRAKNPVSPMIVGVSTAVSPRRGAAGASLGCGAAGILSTPRTNMSGRAATRAMLQAAITAKWSPRLAAKASIVTGATAVPRKPEKVWIEKARPTRAGAIRAERIA
jgi:hypothetical protein